MLYFWDKEVLTVVFSTLKFFQNVHNHLTNYTVSQNNISVSWQPQILKLQGSSGHSE